MARRAGTDDQGTARLDGAGAVLVTGASSGIGQASATALAARGFDVFAGVRTDADAERISDAKRPGLVPIRLDVTEPDSIEQAFGTIGNNDRPLVAVVNNAGIVVSAPLELVPLDALRRQLEVNLVGQVAVTQAAVPLLRETRGRIVNISSLGGRVAFAFNGPYCASKHALEACTDALRAELRPWGITVMAIEPGNVSTPIWQHSRDVGLEILSQLPPARVEPYAERLVKLAGLSERLAQESQPPEKVVRAVIHALTARRPRTRYVVGRDARTMIALKRWLPPPLFEAVSRRALGL